MADSLMKWPERVTIKEVGPRDGLQNEQTMIATADKVAWINHLSATGLKFIEVSSFVNPKWIPTLADAEQVAQRINRHPDITYTALVPNRQGLERALAVNIDETAIFLSASETHNRHNINKSIAHTLPLLKEVITESLAAGKSVRGYISTVFGCPYEGNVPIETVIRVAEELLDMGVGELSLGDTIGVANPYQVKQVLECLLQRFPVNKLALHFHDTRGMALANILTALDFGITTFDGSAGGLGGCPYAPGASGNVATEDMLYMLDGMGIQTGVDHSQLLAAVRFIAQKVNHSLPSHALQSALATDV